MKRSSKLLLVGAVLVAACSTILGIEDPKDRPNVGGGAGSAGKGGAGGKTGGSGGSTTSAGKGGTEGMAGTINETGGTLGAGAAGGSGGAPSGGMGGVVGGGGSCSDSAGAPGFDCSSVGCGGVGSAEVAYAQNYCDTRSQVLKPRQAHEAVTCMFNDCSLHECTASAVADSCLDSDYNDECVSWVATCSAFETIDQVECHALVDGFNDSGISGIGSCVLDTGCYNGLQYCTWMVGAAGATGW